LADMDGDGFERHEQAIKDYAATNGYVIEKVYPKERVLGTIETRTALAGKIVSMEQNNTAYRPSLLSVSDRLDRDFIVQEAIIRDFGKQGFNLLDS